MSPHKHVDDWYLGFTTHAVSPPKSTLPLTGGKTKQNKPKIPKGAGIRNLIAAAKKHPEVMIKIPKRHSGNSKGLKGVANHLSYISRNGEVELETHDGIRICNTKERKQLLQYWQKLGIPMESNKREALNIVLSMPAGTPPDKVLNAAREFAAQQFDGHQYAFALHHESDRDGEPPHPHVHLCLLMQDEYGRRINPRKNDLFHWRVLFAEKLRDEGIQCAATKRQHRGQSLKAENSIIRAINGRLDKQHQKHPEKYSQRQAKVTAARTKNLTLSLKNGEIPQHPFQKKAEQTRRHIIRQYALIARELYRTGYKTEARLIAKLKAHVESQGLDTRDQAAVRAALEKQVRPSEKQQPDLRWHNPSMDIDDGPSR